MSALEARGLVISILDSFLIFSIMLRHFVAHFMVDMQAMTLSAILLRTGWIFVTLSSTFTGKECRNLPIL